jgi:hypothetical protein
MVFYTYTLHSRPTFKGSEQVDVIGFTYVSLLHDELLVLSPNIIRVIKSIRMRQMRYVAHMGEMRGVYKILVRIPEGKRSFGGTGHRCEDNINTDLKELRM